MKNNSSKQHWDEIYKTKDTTTGVSWYQNNPKTSVDLILSANMDKKSSIIDIGGGDSKLAGKLLKLGFRNLFVLDISAAALAKAKERLGRDADLVVWIESDVLEFETDANFDIWHDRAAFHFLTKQEDITNYVETANRLIKPNGYLIVSTFSASGPKKCSGLNVTRYSENSIKKAFYGKFRHIRNFEQTHTTPSGAKQNFLWTIFKNQSN